MTYLIAANRIWYEHLSEELTNLTGEGFLLITKKEELTAEKLKEIKPRYVFLPHWSHLLPQEIYDHYECIIFHIKNIILHCYLNILCN